MSTILGANTINVQASGAILVASIVKMDPANNFCVIQSTGPQDLPMGVAQQGSYNAPGVFAALTTLATNSQTPPTGTAPNPLIVYSIGAVCRLQLSPNCNPLQPGAQLTSDPNGLGIDVGNALNSGQNQKWICAIALTAPVTGQGGTFIRVLVVAPQRVSAISLRYSLTPGTVPPSATADFNFGVLGLEGGPTATVAVSCESLAVGLGIGNARVISQNSLQLRLVNPTLLSIVPVTAWYDIAVIA